MAQGTSKSRPESFGARLGDGVMQALLPLVPLLYLARVLSPAELGLLGLTLAGTSLLQHLIALRAETAVGGAEGPDGAQGARDRAVVLTIALAGLGAIAVGCLVLALRLPALALVFALAPTLAAIRFVGTLELAGVIDEKRIVRHRTLSLLGNIAGLLLTVTLISGFELGWPGRILALVVAEGGVVAVRSALLARRGRGHGLIWDVGRARGLIAAGRPALIAGVLVFVLEHSNRLIAMETLTMADVGYFVVAYRVGSALVTINRSLSFALAPRVHALLETHDRTALVRLHLTYGAALCAGALALALAALGLTGWALGADFAPAAPVIALVTLGYGLQGFQRGAGIMRTRFGLASPSPWHLASAVGLNVTLSLLLAPSFGALGVACGTAAGFAAVAGLSSVGAYRALAD